MESCIVEFGRARLLQPLRLLPQETGRKIRLDNAALIGRLARSFFPLAYYADLNDIPGSVLDAVVSRRNR